MFARSRVVVKFFFLFIIEFRNDLLLDRCEILVVTTFDCCFESFLCIDPLLGQSEMLECTLHIDGYVILGLGSMDTKVMLCIDGVERSRHNHVVMLHGGYAISYSFIE